MKGYGLCVVQDSTQYFEVINRALKVFNQLGFKCRVCQLLLGCCINVATILVEVLNHPIGVPPVPSVDVAVDE